MRSLLAFVIKNNFIFAFLVLQFICALLMVNKNHYQGSHVLNSSNSAIAGVYAAAHNTSEYFELKDENDRLATENARLHNLIKNSYSMLPLTEFKRNDTLYKQQYTYVACKVVNSSVNKRKNFLTLNIGSGQGVRQDMAVMSSDGIVGKITDVSRNFATAMSLLHKDNFVNCQLKKDGSYGPLMWDGGDYRYCMLTDIPTHARLKQGDTVITSDLSKIFPQGIMVGTVESWERRQNESFFTVRVKLSADLKKVNHVYVITNRFKAERDSLEAQTQKQDDD